MSVTLEKAERCPVAGVGGDSKTACMAARTVTPQPGSRLIERFEQLREILRSGSVRQSGVESAPVEQQDSMRASIFFLEGEEHDRRRAAIAPFFTTKAISARHLPVMERTTDAVIADFRAKGSARLDDMTLWLTGAVVAEILGLTDSKLEGLARRIAGSSRAGMAERGGVWKVIANFLAGYYALQVFYKDVRPAAAARRKQRKQDVISRLIDEGRSDKEILIECLTFGLAGMGTTREFAVVAAWHLFEREDLRRRFLDGDEAVQMSILMEILRIEPVASMIYRSVTKDIDGVTPEGLPKGTRLSLHIRAANLDEEVVGPNPALLDPDRAKKMNANPIYMSFGHGSHGCPGWQVGLTEARIFLDRLFRVPGLRLVREPDIHWVPAMLQSYEMRNAIIACDPA